jgi:hypothetical protein
VGLIYNCTYLRKLRLLFIDGLIFIFIILIIIIKVNKDVREKKYIQDDVWPGSLLVTIIATAIKHASWNVIQPSLSWIKMMIYRRNI